MAINKSQENGVLTLSLEGALDNKTSPELQTALTSALDEAKQIRLNFAGAPYITSAGIRVLLLGLKTAKAKGVSIKLSNVSEGIMEMFEVIGFLDILDIE